MSSQDVVDFVRERLPEANDNLPCDPRILEAIMEELLDSCISPDLSTTGGLGGDNMTALVVVFNKGHLARGVSQQAAVLQQHNELDLSPIMEEKAIVPKGLWCAAQT